jgi:hypothetical protein
MIKWLGENRGELVGIKRYLPIRNKVSFLPNLQVSRVKNVMRAQGVH